MAAALVARLRALRTASAGSVAGHNVLGLDVSTKAIGIGIVTGGGELVHTEVITATPDEPLFAVGAAVGERIAQLHAEFPVRYVAVEDVMKGFATGRFQTPALFKLARLNGIIGYECWRRTEAPVALFMPNQVRSFFGLKAAALPEGMDAAIHLAHAGIWAAPPPAAGKQQAVALAGAAGRNFGGRGAGGGGLGGTTPPPTPPVAPARWRSLRMAAPTRYWWQCMARRATRRAWQPATPPRGRHGWRQRQQQAARPRRCCRPPRTCRRTTSTR